jgi:hypothetical protein
MYEPPEPLLLFRLPTFSLSHRQAPLVPNPAHPACMFPPVTLMLVTPPGRLACNTGSHRHDHYRDHYYEGEVRGERRWVRLIKHPCLARHRQKEGGGEGALFAIRGIEPMFHAEAPDV